MMHIFNKQRLLSPSASQSPINGQPGQVAVVILLIMAVILVIGLSVASRATQDIQVTTQDQDNARVFNAAETGVDKALADPNSNNFIGAGADSGVVTDNSLQVQTRITTTPQNGVTTHVPMGAAATIYYNNANSSQVDVYWSLTSQGLDCNSRAAVLITVYYSDNGNPNGPIKSAYYPVRPNCLASANPNKASGFASSISGNGTYDERYQLDASAYDIKFIRVQALYAQTDVYVPDAPQQAYDIRSEAQDISNGANTTGEKSAIKVTRLRPAPPVIFDYGVYSGGDLVGRN